MIQKDNQEILLFRYFVLEVVPRQRRVRRRVKNRPKIDVVLFYSTYFHSPPPFAPHFPPVPPAPLGRPHPPRADRSRSLTLTLTVEIITRRDNVRHNVKYETPPVSTLEELQTDLAANATKMDISLDGEEESVLPVATLVKKPIDAMCYGSKPTRLKLAFQTLDGLIPIKIVHVLSYISYVLFFTSTRKKLTRGRRTNVPGTGTACTQFSV
jgi:hypothetical protein